MGFNNPLTGQNGSLIYQQIKSPNYSVGVSGWIVKKDGSAEFNNLTIRGTFFGADFIINSSGIFFYSGTPATGNLLISLASVAGTDSFGNVYPQGLNITTAGKAVVMGLTGGAPLIYFTSGLAGLTNGAALQDIILGSGTGRYDFLQILGAEETTHNDLMLLSLGSSSADGTQVPTITMQYKDGGGVFHTLYSLISTGLTLGTPLTAQQIAQAFGADTVPLINQSDTVSSLNGFIKQTHAAAASLVLRALVSGDTNDRFNIKASGTMGFGSGTATQDAFFQRVAAAILAINPTLLVGSTTALGDNGSGEIQVANATTVPTTNPVGGFDLYAKQGVPSVRDPGGQLLGMVRSYSANSTSNLASFTAETDVPGATVSVVVTGSNATVIVHGEFDFMIGTTAGTTMVGILSWNGADRGEQAVFIAPTVGARSCCGRTWRIAGVTAGTYVAKLRATCTASAANNLVEFPHTGLVVEVIDQ